MSHSVVCWPASVLSIDAPQNSSSSTTITTSAIIQYHEFQQYNTERALVNFYFDSTTGEKCVASVTGSTTSTDLCSWRLNSNENYNTLYDAPNRSRTTVPSSTHPNDMSPSFPLGDRREETQKRPSSLRKHLNRTIKKQQTRRLSAG